MKDAKFNHILEKSQTHGRESLLTTPLAYSRQHMQYNPVKTRLRTQTNNQRKIKSYSYLMISLALALAALLLRGGSLAALVVAAAAAIIARALINSLATTAFALGELISALEAAPLEETNLLEVLLEHNEGLLRKSLSTR